ncbi:hypothetical protein RhiirA4_460385 [Rhizophagus irregularis]|uniref:Uncharacterized protein n=1 Tax=Rhizophagus irregularis TaxID=588596 RepID=A0A2I1GGH7_9GLOM|nr:hypothetical protein RhiirA4_460385 [Rhizophagus irregularis]
MSHQLASQPSRSDSQSSYGRKLLIFQKAQESEEVQEEEEEYTRSSEIIIKENVSLKQYLLLSYTHSATIGCVIGLINRWNDQDLEYGTDATMIPGQNTAREPDISLTFIKQPLSTLIHKPQFEAVAVNQFVGKALVVQGQIAGDATITGATFIPNHTV